MCTKKTSGVESSMYFDKRSKSEKMQTNETAENEKPSQKGKLTVNSISQPQLIGT